VAFWKRSEQGLLKENQRFSHGHKLYEALIDCGRHRSSAAYDELDAAKIIVLAERMLEVAISLGASVY
jgi:hypothetical protein